MTVNAARMIGVDQLPVARTEIELSCPPQRIELANKVQGAGTIMALVRFHTHPVGIVLLDGALGTSWECHRRRVWDAVGRAVGEHCQEDGLSPGSQPGTLTLNGRVPGCVLRRRAARADAAKISVVVATRERPESLRMCLKALFEVDYPAYEVIVVDNDPLTTATAAMVQEEFDGVVRYVREPDRGLASAHNRGVAEASGKVIAFVDDDVIVDRHWLEAIAEGFAAADDVGCVTGLILPSELDTRAQLLLEQHGGFDKGFGLRIYDSGPHRPDHPLFPFTPGRFGSGANMAFDAAILREMGGFDKATGVGTYARGGDDLAAIFRVVLDHRVVYQPSAIVWHRHHRELDALRNQAFGYGVGLGAFLASALVHEPRAWPTLLRRLPAGLRYAFSAHSDRNRGRYDGWPAEFTRLERRGLLYGPVAYAISRWRKRRRIALPAT